MPNEIESYTPFYKGKPLYGLGGGGGGSSTDENVMQTPTDNSNNDYEVLMSYSADNTERTESTRKTQHIKFNPFTKLLKLTGHLYDKWGLQTSRSLFQSEFDNLTQSEKDNGTTYYIKDGVPLRICDYIYPVGAIYMSVNNISPALLFGGTWERIKDRFLLAAGDDYTAGSTGGEAEHILTTDEIPAHAHNFKSSNYGWESTAIPGASMTASGSNIGLSPYNAYNGSNNNIVMQNTGGGQAHNNMPPYLTVYMWKRIADPVQQEENNEEQGE